MKTFKKLTSFGTRKAVIDLLLKLSDGWRPQRRMAAVSESSLEIKSFKVSSLCVISTVDIELTNSGYTQVLRIWDLLPLEDIPEFVTHLDRIFEKYSDDFMTLCNEKCFEGYVASCQVVLCFFFFFKNIQFNLNQLSNELLIFMFHLSTPAS